MRVFITGATGFIGQRVVRKLLQRHHQVKALVRRPDAATNLRALGVDLVPGDVTQASGLADAMEGSDWLLHLANRYSLYEPDERVYAEVNVQGNHNVMAAALQARVGKVVHVSSIVAYGASPDQPLRGQPRRAACQYLCAHQVRGRPGRLGVCAPGSSCGDDLSGSGVGAG